MVCADFLRFFTRDQRRQDGNTRLPVQDWEPSIAMRVETCGGDGGGASATGNSLEAGSRGERGVEDSGEGVSRRGECRGKRD